MIIVVSNNEVISVTTTRTVEQVIRDLCLARDLPQPDTDSIRKSLDLDDNFVVQPNLWVCKRDFDEDNENLL